MKRTRIAAEVTAGVIPGQPEEEFRKRWVITSDDWYAEGADQVQLLAETNGPATTYANYLMLQPDRVNWVRLDWIYF